LALVLESSRGSSTIYEQLSELISGGRRFVGRIALACELRGKASLVLSKQHYDRDALITAVRQLLPIGGA
jgi:hypothetical protein